MAYRPQGLAVLILDRIVDLISSPRTNTISQSFSGKKFMCKFPNGQLYFESKLALDTDGSVFAKQDPSGQAATSAKDANGNFLDADRINYFVLPGGFASKHHIRIGDIGVVINGIRKVYACFGDVGPSHSLGEGSISLHRELGHETVVGGHFINAGLPGGMITIVFPGSGNGRGRTNLESARIGALLFQKLQDEAEVEQLRRAELQERARRDEEAKHPRWRYVWD
jgi:hypothetical protein